MIADEAEFAFRLSSDAKPLILLDTVVDGQGPFPFLLDTGSAQSLVARRLADTLGLNPTGSLQAHGAAGPVSFTAGKVDSISVGSARLEGIAVGITDELDRIGTAVGAQIDGCIGYNFLSSFSFTLDYRRGKLRWNPADSSLEGTSGVQPFRLAHPKKPLILVEALVNEQGPYTFALDTGATRSVLAPAVAAELSIESVARENATGGGGNASVCAGRLSSLRVGSSRVDNLNVIIGAFMSDLSVAAGIRLDGIIGYDFLQSHILTVDYPNHRLILAR